MKASGEEEDTPGRRRSSSRAWWQGEAWEALQRNINVNHAGAPPGGGDEEARGKEGHPAALQVGIVVASEGGSAGGRREEEEGGDVNAAATAKINAGVVVEADAPPHAAEQEDDVLSRVRDFGEGAWEALRVSLSPSSSRSNGDGGVVVVVEEEEGGGKGFGEEAWETLRSFGRSQVASALDEGSAAGAAEEEEDNVRQIQTHSDVSGGELDGVDAVAERSVTVPAGEESPAGVDGHANLRLWCQERSGPVPPPRGVDVDGPLRMFAEGDFPHVVVTELAPGAFDEAGGDSLYPRVQRAPWAEVGASVITAKCPRRPSDARPDWVPAGTAGSHMMNIAGEEQVCVVQGASSSKAPLPLSGDKGGESETAYEEKSGIETDDDDNEEPLPDERPSVGIQAAASYLPGEHVMVNGRSHGHVRSVRRWVAAAEANGQGDVAAVNNAGVSERDAAVAYTVLDAGGRHHDSRSGGRCDVEDGFFASAISEAHRVVYEVATAGRSNRSMRVLRIERDEARNPAARALSLQCCAEVAAACRVGGSENVLGLQCFEVTAATESGQDSACGSTTVQHVYVFTELTSSLSLHVLGSTDPDPRFFNGLGPLYDLPPDGRHCIEHVTDRLQNILRQVALGLDWMHRRGVLHMDVRPWNIHITDRGVAKLSDFGLSSIGNASFQFGLSSLMFWRGPESQVRSQELLMVSAPFAGATPSFWSPEIAEYVKTGSIAPGLGQEQPRSAAATTAKSTTPEDAGEKDNPPERSDVDTADRNVDDANPENESGDAEESEALNNDSVDAAALSAAPPVQATGLTVKACSSDIWAWACTALQIYAGARTWPCGKGECAERALQNYAERSTGLASWTEGDVHGWAATHPKLSPAARSALADGVDGSCLLGLTDGDDGELALRGLSLHDRRSVTDAVALAAGVRRRMSSVLQSILTSCLRENPHDRPQRVTTLLHALRVDPNDDRKREYLAMLNVNDMDKIRKFQMEAKRAASAETAAADGNSDADECEDAVRLSSGSVSDSGRLQLGREAIRGYTRGHVRGHTPPETRSNQPQPRADLADGAADEEIPAQPHQAGVEAAVGADGDAPFVVNDEAAATTLANLGNLLYQNGDSDGAEAAYASALSGRLSQQNISQSLRATLFYNLGHCQQDRGQYALSVASYQRALRCDANHLEALLNLGLALAEVGKMEEAIRLYLRALDAHPQSVGLLYNLGLVLQRSGRAKEAIDSYRHALVFLPGHIPSLCNLGLALEERTRPGWLAKWGLYGGGNAAADAAKAEALDEAIGCYSRAMELRPNNPQIITNLALLMRRAGNDDRCIALCRAVLDRSDGAGCQAFAHHNMGLSLLAKRDAKGACYHLQLAMRLPKLAQDESFPPKSMSDVFGARHEFVAECAKGEREARRIAAVEEDHMHKSWWATARSALGRQASMDNKRSSAEGGNTTTDIAAGDGVNKNVAKTDADTPPRLSEKTVL